MRLHLVKPYNSIAMQRLCQPLQELSTLYQFTTSDKPDNEAGINLHIPWHTLANHDGGRHVIAYTHCNPGDEAALILACQKAEAVTAMSFTGRNELLNYGLDPKKIHVIPCASDMSLRRRTVLIVGSVQPNGRKRESLILDLAWQYDVSFFEFVFVGTGWESVVTQLQSMGVKARMVTPKDDAELQNLYYAADVLLVTGYVEGGPLPVLEAMAAGTNILSPAFGYAKDYLSCDELYTDTRDLYEKLTRLTTHRIYNHKIVRAWGWVNYVMEYALLLGRLTGTSVDLFPEYGVSRYAQLLDLIDARRPRRIAEIGTWNGNNAIRMLQAAGKYYPADLLRYQGFDLFEQQTGEQLTRELSKYAQSKDAVQKRISATGANVQLVEGDTRYSISRLMPADLYFVDGGHSEYTIENDGAAVLRMLTPGAAAVFDDYYHSGKPDGVGCNQFIDRLPNEYSVKHLPARTLAQDGREIGMVMVCRNTSIVAN